MGLVERVGKPDWKQDKTIIRLLEISLCKEAIPVDVTFINYERSMPSETNKFIEVVYKLGEMLYRTELKYRDDSNRWEKENNNAKKRKNKRRRRRKVKA